MAYYDYPYYYPNYYTGNRFQDWRDRMFIGEPVIGEDGDHIGRVEDIFDYGFRIMRPFADDVFLPYDAIQDIFDSQVQLNLPADEVGTSYGAYNAYNHGRRYGPYTGYGPRNYHRSDEQIKDDISDQMWSNGQLDASGITVSVLDGVVTLDGTVDSRWAKRKAEDIAWTTAGVNDVINNLHRTGALWNNFRSQLYTGMDIVGSLGRKVGTVGEIRDYQFLANRADQPGLWIPFSAIQDVRNNRVILNVTVEEIRDKGWLTTEAQSA